MNDLVAWLTQILDEDKAVARATEHADGPATLHWMKAGGQRHHRFDNGRSESYTAVRCGEWERILIARDGVAGGPLAAHVAGHDPAAVLADIAAKRAMIGDYRFLLINQGPADEMTKVAASFVRRLASAYGGRPGYREEWRL